MARTPAVNDIVVIGAPVSVPVEVSITLNPLPSKAVTVLLLASLAMVVILKAVPAVCGLLIVENTNFANEPAVNVTVAV